jgi:O-methyltransferase
MSVKSFVKRNVKLIFAPLVYRSYPIVLQPSRLYFWLDVLHMTRYLTGAVIEVGVAEGGTSAFSFNFLNEIASRREYIGIDTFSGFVKEHFAEDVRLGNDPSKREAFSATSIDVVRKVLRMHGAEKVRLIQADISKIDESLLPTSISACLLDVDLAIPIYDGLKVLWPRLEDGGIIVVDDCYENNADDWQAIIGYRKFCEEKGLNEQFFCGTGYLVKGSQTADILNRQWNVLSSSMHLNRLPPAA